MTTCTWTNTPDQAFRTITPEPARTVWTLTAIFEHNEPLTGVESGRLTRTAAIARFMGTLPVTADVQIIATHSIVR